jgi:hypothetical protein
MLLAIMDSDSRLRLYQAEPGGMTELAALVVADTDPAAVARVALVLADMAGQFPSNGNGKKLRSDKGKPRQTPRKPSTPLGAGKVQLLGLMADGEWWTAAQLAEKAPDMSRGGLAASLSQWAQKGQLDSQQVPNPALGTARGQTRPQVKAYRITDAGRLVLGVLQERMQKAS